MSEADSNAEWRQYWAEMETACRRLLHYTRDWSRHDLEQDEKTVDAVLYNLDRIYRSAQSLPDDIHPRLSEAEWRTINGFQERVAEPRSTEQAGVLWELVNQQVPELLQALREAHKESSDIKRHGHLRLRGRNAAHPWEISRLGWRDIGWRIWAQMQRNNIFIVSAGVAFYGLLAIFPALAALLSSYGLLFNPADVTAQLAVFGSVLPETAWSVLHDWLQMLTNRSETSLGIGAFFGFLFTLWSARAGLGGILIALNIAYEEQEKRSLLRFYFTALILTIGAIVFSVTALALIVALPAVLAQLGLDSETKGLMNLVRWPLLAASIMLALAVVYRFGPSRNPPRWEWVSVGSVIATLLWLSGSLLFSFYVANFGSYDETYGSVGAVVVLMLWFWLTAFIILMGAVLNAEMEHQTKKDTTSGKPKPMGRRNAYMADTLGRRP